MEELGKDKIEYFQCCGDLDHITRFYYNHEIDELYFEYRLNKFPGHFVPYWPAKTTDPWYKKFSMWFVWKIKCFLDYLKHIKNAILGKPNWWVGQAVIDQDEIPKLIKFLRECK